MKIFGHRGVGTHPLSIRVVDDEECEERAYQYRPTLYRACLFFGTAANFFFAGDHHSEVYKTTRDLSLRVRERGLLSAGRGDHHSEAYKMTRDLSEGMRPDQLPLRSSVETPNSVRKDDQVLLPYQRVRVLHVR